MERLIVDHTIVCDLERSTVEFVAEERRTASLAAHYQAPTDEQRDGLKAVAMDMWEPYIPPRGMASP